MQPHLYILERRDYVLVQEKAYMKYIISGTDRADSNSFKVAQYIQKLWSQMGEQVEIIDLKDVKETLVSGPHYGSSGPDKLSEYTQKILNAEGLIVVVPEYNGSMPGVLKYFIDHLKFPESFEYRPVCFIGLGGLFGGLRPVEHLQQVFGYRNAFIYPERVFMMNVWKIIQGGEVTDATVAGLLAKQAKGFKAFCQALKVSGLDANTYMSSQVKK